MAHENYIKFNFSFEKHVSLEHTCTMPIHLHIGLGCFCIAVAKLNSCKRDQRAHKAKNIYYLIL